MGVDPIQPDDLTFVVCVESGHYETMAVRMVESLRDFGGRLATAPVLAITPRLGPGPSLGTRRRFAELGVEHVRTWHFRRAWFAYYPKVWALADGERLATTASVAYVDSDVLFLSEPRELLLPAGAVVAACPRDDGIVGTTGPESRYEHAWRRSCEAVGLSVDDLPWIDPHDGSPRIRFYLNAGVVVVRREAHVTRQWIECTEAMFRHRVDFGVWREQFHEQVALGLAVVRHGLGFHPLPWSHNYGVDSSLPDAYARTELADACILHYHDQLSAEHWDQTVERLRHIHPHVGDWLAESGPVVDASSSAAHLARRSLRFGRHWRRRLYRFPDWLVRRRFGRRPVVD